jgi:hypothetical protein
MPPWGTISEAFTEAPLYPSASLIETTLRGQNVMPEAQTTLPLDYLHRKIGTADVYFIRNTTDQWTSGACTFRTRLPNVQIWDPVSVTQEAPAVQSRASNTVQLYLELEPHGSRFVLFDEASSTIHLLAGMPFESSRVVQQITGPYTVQFQSDRGAPHSIQLTSLQDLSTHSDPGVRHFSGITTYTTTFTLRPHELARGTRFQLDLGNVGVMARPYLNGNPLRTLWCAPYTVEIAADALRGENTLTVEVANLWPNRLIGDSALPENQRIARTTWNPFKPDDPLPASGLIGPVVLRHQADQ